MAQFVNDTFTDADSTALTSHTGETGATWTKHGFSEDTGSDNPIITSNLLRPRTTTALRTIYYASGSPAAADYTVSVDYVVDASGVEATEIFGVVGRVATGANTFYAALYMQNAGGIRIYKFVTGTGTVIVTAVSVTLSSSATYRLTLDMQGSTIAARFQRASDSNWLTSSGTWQASQTNLGSTTDTAITAAGKAGFWSNGTRPRGNNFSADDVAGGTTAPINVLVPNQLLALSSATFRGV